MNHTAPSFLRRLWHTRLRDTLRGRLNSNLDWQQVIATANLPPELAGEVHNVVRRTRLWRGEKVDVAMELIAHFQDGLESGRAPDELRKSFGNPLVSAKLIRRAKKRGRPMTWQVWRIGLWMFLGLIAVYVLAGVCMMMGRPSVKTDYLSIINQQALEAPESERAWPLYRDALLAMGINAKAESDAAKKVEEAKSAKDNRELMESQQAQLFDADSSAAPTTETTVNPPASAPADAATTPPLEQPIDEEVPLLYTLFDNEKELKPGDPNWAEVEKFLNDNASSLAKIREATSKKRLGFAAANSRGAFSERDRELFWESVTPDEIAAAKNETINNRWMISTLLPHYSQLANCRTLLKLDARRAAAAGDSPAALANIMAMLGLSRHSEEIPVLVGTLSAKSYQESALDAIQDTMREHPDLWTNDQLRDLAHAVAKTTIDWRRGIEGERSSFDDCLQRLYTDNGNGDGRLTLFGADNENLFQLIESAATGSGAKSTMSETALAMAALPAANMLVASRKEMSAMYNHLTDIALENLDVPLWQQPATVPEEEIDVICGNLIDRIHYLFVGIMYPAYSHLRSAVACLNGERDGVLLGIALELYHRENGKWPESLTELAPRWIPEVPVDRITGKPLRYKIVDDRPVVYSVGVDVDDDGGRAPADETGIKLRHSLASPWEYQGRRVKPLTDVANDGDWILWSMEPEKNDEKQN